MLTFDRPWTTDEIKKHISSQIENSSVTAVNGQDIDLPVGDHDVSLCCHSDSPGAVQIVSAARQMVNEHTFTTLSKTVGIAHVVTSHTRAMQ